MVDFDTEWVMALLYVHVLNLNARIIALRTYLRTLS